MKEEGLFAGQLRGTALLPGGERFVGETTIGRLLCRYAKIRHDLDYAIVRKCIV